MKFLLNIFIALFIGQTVGLATGVDPTVATLSIGALMMVPKQLPSGVLLSSVDVSLLTAYSGKNMKELLFTLVNQMEAALDFVVMPNVKNKMRIGKLNVSSGTRPFSSTEEFLGDDLSYTDRFLETFPGKRELLIDVEEYTQTYLSEFLTPGSGANKSKSADIPFEAWTMDKIVKTVAAELNNKTTYAGFDKADAVLFDAGDTYAEDDYVRFTVDGVVHWWKCVTATTAGQTPVTHAAKWQKVDAEAITKGIGTLINEEITAGKIVPVTGVTITTGATALAAFKKLFRAMPITYRTGGIIINCSYTDFDFLIDGIDDIAKYAVYDQTSKESIRYVYLPGSQRQCIVKPSTWNTSRRLIAGPAKVINGEYRNAALYLGTDLLSDFNSISVKESNLWDCKVGIKFRLGFQIANLEEIKVGDQE